MSTQAQPVHEDTDRSIEQLAGALDEAMGRLSGLEPDSRAVITDALDALNALHKQALTTVVRRLRDDPRGKQLLFELVDEPDVLMVLTMHGLVRPDQLTLARRVLDSVRPGLESHGGGVELDRIDGSTAFVRLQGACNGCSMASVTMRNGVEAALVEGVPGLTSVEVLPNDPTPTLIPLSSITVGSPDAAAEDLARAERELEEAGWSSAVAAEAVGVGEVCAVTLTPRDAPSLEVIVVNAAGQMSAFVNECAHLGRRLDDALIDAGQGTITCAGHGFCYDSTNGECMSMPGAQLQQLPLRLEHGQVWVRCGGDLGG
ncbi:MULTISPECIES: NifU family protein [Nocardioides]|uniref:NifU family protein n=1 Tax=Nocardioides TaxID=1839 RepID=UPI00032ED2E7|nr:MULTISPECIES: NifU family protein [Nocardioides]EON22104.1 nitrogen-fixing NifU domain-containing protein [Nocardioides sp. CF8]